MDDILFFDYNQKSSVLLIFFFHAMVFTFLLFKKGLQELKKDSLWLAGFVFLGGLYIAPFMLGYGGWYSIKSYREFMFFMPFQQLFLIGPVFYFYIKSLIHTNFKLTHKDMLHLLPALLYLGYSLVVFVVDKLVLDQFYFYADGRDKDLDFWYQFMGLLSMLYYLYRSYRYYKSYRKASLEEVSFADAIAFRWVQLFTLTFGFILLLRVLFFILNPEWGEFGSKYWYYLCFSMIMLYITLTGYAHTLKSSLKFAVPSLPPLESETSPSQSIPSESGYDTDDLKEWKEQITQLFQQDTVYMNPNVTLSDVSQLLHTNRNIISKTINQEFGMNFNDFVNQKRAEAVIKKLHEGAHTHHTLLSIALDCGFNSKTTFNRAFKKHTALTPKQYLVKNNL